MANPQCEKLPFQYEIDVYSSLIEWLHEASDISWARSFSEGEGLPESSFAGQYGVINIDTIKPRANLSNKSEDTIKPSDELCTVFKHSVYADLTLTVYGQLKMDEASTGVIVKTPADVLLRLFDSFNYIPCLKRTLADLCIRVVDVGDISNSIEARHGSFLRVGSMNLTIEYLRYSSYVSNKVNVEIGNCCDQ